LVGVIKDWMSQNARYNCEEKKVIVVVVVVVFGGGGGGDSRACHTAVYLHQTTTVIIPSTQHK
jgi:hypothetical protein